MHHKILSTLVESWVCLCFLATPSLGLEKINVGLGSFSAMHGDIWDVSDQGYFKEYGLEPTEIYIQGGPTAMSGLLADSIQYLVTDGAAPVGADLKGADVVIVASGMNQGIQRLMARPDLKNPQDLVGKKVGVTRVGTSSYNALWIMCEKWGIPFDKVQVLQVGSSTAMLASLAKGGIDAAVLTLPSFFAAEDKGYRLLGDAVTMGINTLHQVLVVRRDYLDTHQDQVTRFIKAYLKGIAYFKQNKEESLAVLKRKLGQRGKGEYLERSYDLLAKDYEMSPYPSVTGVKTILRFLAKEYPKATEADPKAFIDDSIVKNLDQSGFIQNLYRK
jgi:ABC-type nitrate/sulfonate/bicarbonate transport system substrate-binding protein